MQGDIVPIELLLVAMPVVLISLGIVKPNRTAKQIRKPKGDEERVGHAARAQHGGDQDIPYEAEDATQHGVAAYSGDSLQKIHRV